MLVIIRRLILNLTLWAYKVALSSIPEGGNKMLSLFIYSSYFWACAQ